MNRIAIIDLGTNTFHLLIAELQKTGYEWVYRDKVPVKLGKGGINESIIQPDAIGRAIKAIGDFVIVINKWQVSQTFAFGTSALRNAANAKQVTDAILQATGVPITIIDGNKEAEYIYYGVRAAVALGEAPSLIVDIGGGSVEFIIANAQEIFWKQSVEIGAQRLLEKFHTQDPITLEEIINLENYFDEMLTPLVYALTKWNPTALVGSSGTFDTFSEIYARKNNIPIHEHDAETPLTLGAVQDIHTQLITKNRAERMAIPGMIEMRVDMIVVASCLIQYLLSKHSFSKIRVSSYSLKEGVLSQLNLP